jgi:hypothetical protein
MNLSAIEFDAAGNPHYVDVSGNVIGYSGDIVTTSPSYAGDGYSQSPVTPTVPTTAILLKYLAIAFVSVAVLNLLMRSEK